jgi:TolB-like protein/Tfp pilus assembly protein PilF
VLVGRLWSDRDDEQARGSLRQAIVELRRAIDPPGRAVIRAEREQIGLDLDAVDVDVITLQRLAAAADLEAAQQVASVYGGELLEGLAIRDEAFEEWIRNERARLQDIAANALLKVVRSAQGADADAVIEAARKLLAIDGVQEEAHRALLRCYLARGQIALAKRQADACLAVLDEFGVEPEPETAKLIADARRGGEPVRRAQAAPALRPARVRSVARPRVAVLPFANLGGAADETYFAVGVTEDVCTALGRFSALEVIAPYAAFPQAEAASDPREIGRRLDADYVVSGSVRRGGERVRISARLLDVASGGQIWAHNLDRDLGDIFAVQEELARFIAAVLPGRVEEAHLDQTRDQPTSELSAYDLVLRATYLLQRATAEANAQARAYLREAIAIDPDYARAHREAALAAFDAVFMRWSDERILPDALRLARRAVSLEPNDAAAHGVTAMILFLMRRDSEARAYLDRAELLNPHDPELLAHGALFRLYTGEPAAAREHVRRAIELNPYHPDWYFAALGTAAFIAGDPDGAIDAYNRRHDHDRLVCAYLAACLAEIGRHDEAAQMRAQCVVPGEDIAAVLAGEAGLYRRPVDRVRLLDGMRQAGLTVDLRLVERAAS